MKFARGMWFIAVLGSLLLGAAGGYAQTQETTFLSYAEGTIVSGCGHASSVAVDGRGNVYIADTGNTAAEGVAATGWHVSELNHPTGVTVGS